MRIRKFFAIVIAIMVGVLGVPNSRSATAQRANLIPLPATASITTVTNKDTAGFRGLVVDEVNRQVYAILKTSNTVIAFGFDGAVRAMNETLAQPDAIAVASGNVYVTLSGTGQIVRLNPTTLLPTVVATGLPSAAGLAETGGKLYTFSGQTTTSRNLVEVDPGTGLKTTITNEYYSYWSDIVAFAQSPGVLYYTREGLSPGGIYRRQVSSGLVEYAHKSPTEFALTMDGALVTTSGISDEPSGLLARNASTLAFSGRQWPAWQTSWNASPTVPLLVAGGYSQVKLYSSAYPDEIYRSYTLTDASVLLKGVRTDSIGSTIFVATSYGGNFRLYVLAGVGFQGASQGTSSGLPRTRAAASQARTGTTLPRSAAPPTRFGPAWFMTAISDIEFATDGTVYASDDVTGVVNLISQTGTPITGWKNLSGVAALAELNGTMYGTLGREGSIVKFEWKPVLTRIATGIPSASGLVAADNLLWTTINSSTYSNSALAVNPGTGATTPYPGWAWNWPNALLAERPVGRTLVGYQSYGLKSFSLDGFDYSSSYIDAQPPFSVDPSGTYVLAGNGIRFSGTPLAADGFNFPGTKHTMSGSIPGRTGLVAAEASYPSTGLIVYDETNPGNIVYRSLAPVGYDILRLEFRPNTAQLWTAFRSQSTGQVIVAPFTVPAQAPTLTANGDSMVVAMAPEPHLSLDDVIAEALAVAPTENASPNGPSSTPDSTPTTSATPATPPVSLTQLPPTSAPANPGPQEQSPTQTTVQLVPALPGGPSPATPEVPTLPSQELDRQSQPQPQPTENLVPTPNTRPVVKVVIQGTPPPSPTTVAPIIAPTVNEPTQPLGKALQPTQATKLKPQPQSRKKNIRPAAPTNNTKRVPLKKGA